MFVGGKTKSCSRTFKQAKHLILFFIDGDRCTIGRAREQNAMMSNDEENTMETSYWLKWMVLGTDLGIIIAPATNRPDCRMLHC
jgi:ATP-dependent Zn protease